MTIENIHEQISNAIDDKKQLILSDTLLNSKGITEQLTLHFATSELTLNTVGITQVADNHFTVTGSRQTAIYQIPAGTTVDTEIVFFLENGNAEVLITIDLPDDWTFAESFPTLLESSYLSNPAIEVEETPVFLFDDLALSNIKFVIASHVGKKEDVIPWTKGLNLAATLDGKASPAIAFAHRLFNDPVTLRGAIDVTTAIPRVDLQATISESIAIDYLAASPFQFSVFTEDRSTEEFSLVVAGLAITSELVLGGGSKIIPLRFEGYYFQPSIQFVANLAISLADLSLFDDLVQGANLTELIPDDLLPINGLQLSTLEVTFDSTDLKIEAISLWLDLKQPWAIIPDTFSALPLNAAALKFNFLVTNPADATNRTLTFSVLTAIAKWSVVEHIVELVDIETLLRVTKVGADITATGFLGGKIKLGRSTILSTYFPIPLTSGKIAIESASAIVLPDLNVLNGWIGGANFSRLLPEDLVKITAFTLEYARLELDLEKRDLEQFQIQISTTEAWAIVPDKIAMEQVIFASSISAPRTDREIDASVNGVIKIGVENPIHIFLQATYQGSDKTLIFTGNTGAGEEILLSRLTDGLATSFGDFELPDFLKDLALSNVSVIFNQSTQDFSFECTTSLTIDGKSAELLLLIDISNTVIGFQKFFSGTLLIGARSFDVSFLLTENEQVLQAIFRNRQGEPFDPIGELLELISEETNLQLIGTADTSGGEDDTVDLNFTALKLYYLQLKYEKDKVNATTSYSFSGKFEWHPKIPLGLAEPFSPVVAAEISDLKLTKIGKKKKTSGTIQGRLKAGIPDFESLDIGIEYQFGNSATDLTFDLTIKEYKFIATYSKAAATDTTKNITKGDVTLEFGIVQVTPDGQVIAPEMVLGDIITFVVALVDPNIDHFDFEPPWNFITNFPIGQLIANTKLVVELKKSGARTLGVNFTNVDQLIPSELKSVLNITGVGIKFESKKAAGGGKNKKKNKRVLLSLQGALLGKPIPAWDPINEAPPAIPGKGASVFDLRYLGLGQHVTIAGVNQAKNIKEIMDLLRGVIQEGTGKLIANRDLSQRPPMEDSPIIFSPESEWLIGADMSLLKALNLSVIFNDPFVYGLRIELYGDLAKKFAGLEFEILYRRIDETTGVYHLEFVLPDYVRHFELGSVSITLPELILDIFTNGDFKVDLGFPWNFNYARSFSIEVFPFIGKGGFYFNKLSAATATSTPKPKPGKKFCGEFTPVYEFGIGLQIGLGKSFEKGPFKAEISIAIEGMIQGVISWYNSQVTQQKTLYYAIRGGISLVAKLIGAVDLLVIKIEVEVTARATIQFAIVVYKPIYVKLKAEVEVAATVSILGIEVEKSFEMTVEQEFTIGTETPAIWDQEAIDVGKKHRGLGRRSVQSRALINRRRRLDAPISFNWDIAKSRNLSTKTKTTLNLFFQPGLAWTTESKDNLKGEALFFLENVTDGTADKKDFDTFTIALFRWVCESCDFTGNKKLGWEEVQNIYDAFVDPKQNQFSDDQIAAFIASKFIFQIEHAPKEMKGVIFPVLPQLKMTLGKVGEKEDDKKVIDFGAIDYKLDKEGLEQLNAHFSKLKVQFEKQDSTATGNETSTPITKFILRDYIRLIIRRTLQIFIQELKALRTEATNEKLIALRKASAIDLSLKDLQAKAIDEKLEINKAIELTDEQLERIDEISLTASQLAAIQGIRITEAFINRIESIGLNEDQLEAMKKVGLSTEQLAEIKALALPAEEIAKIEKEQYPAAHLIRINRITLSSDDEAKIIQSTSFTFNQLLPILNGAKAEKASKTKLDDLAAMASHYLLHGIRLPKIAKKPAPFNKELALYQATQQQFELKLAKVEEHYKIKLEKGTIGNVALQFGSDGKAKALLFDTGTAANSDFLTAIKAYEKVKTPKLSKPNLTLSAFYEEEHLHFALRKWILWEDNNNILLPLPKSMETYLLEKANNPTFTLYKESINDGQASIKQDTLLPVIAWSTQIELNIRAVPNPKGGFFEDIFALSSAGEATKNSLEYILQDKAFSAVSLLYTSEGNQSVKKLPALNASSTTIIKRNLVIDNTEVVSGKNVTTYEAKINEVGNFLRLNLEAAKVSTGGYFLHIPHNQTTFKSANNDKSLYQILFANEDSATIILVAGSNTNIVKDYHNCVQMASLDDLEASLILAKSSEKVPVQRIPAGFIGFEVERAITKASDIASVENLYQLLGYKVVAAGGFHASEFGMPIGPTKGRATHKAAKKWLYERTIPTFKLADTPTRQSLLPIENDPYRGISATSKITLNTWWQDIYGNCFREDIHQPQRVGYTDALININQWPSISENYEITKNANNLNAVDLTLEFSFDSSTYAPASYNGDLARRKKALEGARKIYETIYYQLNQPDVEMKLSTSIMDMAITEVETAFSNQDGTRLSLLKTFIFNIYQFLDNSLKNLDIVFDSPTSFRPASFVIPYKKGTAGSTTHFYPTQFIFPVKVMLTITRNIAMVHDELKKENDKNYQNVQKATAVLSPKMTAPAAVKITASGTSLAELVANWSDQQHKPATVLELVNSNQFRTNVFQPNKRIEQAGAIVKTRENDTFAEVVRRMKVALNAPLNSGAPTISFALEDLVNLIKDEKNLLHSNAELTFGTYNLRTFATNFEAAFSGLKLAISKENLQKAAEDKEATEGNRQLWAVQLGTQGIQYDLLNQPAFLALAPLSRALFSKEVAVDNYTNWKGSKNTNFKLAPTAKKQFEAVDINVLAREFLVAVETFLEPEYFIPAKELTKDATATKDLVTKIIGHKEQLAKGIVGNQLKPILKDQKELSGNRKKKAQEALLASLLTNLVEGYDIETVVQYESAIDVGTHLKDQLSWDVGKAPCLAGKAKIIGVKEGGASMPLGKVDFSLSAGKIDLTPGKGSFTYLFDTKTPEKFSSLELELNFDTAEIEYFATTQDGGKTYDKPTWLSFILPSSLTIPMGKTEVPIPLRSYPMPPSLIRHQAEADPDSLEELFRIREWAYTMIYEHPDIAQDSIDCVIKLNTQPVDRLAKKRSAVKRDDLFKSLANFMECYPGIAADLAKLKDAPLTQPEDINAAKSGIIAFESLVEEVTSAWTAWENSSSSNFDEATGTLHYEIKEEIDNFTRKEKDQEETVTLKQVTIIPIKSTPINEDNPNPRLHLPGYDSLDAKAVKKIIEAPSLDDNQLEGENKILFYELDGTEQLSFGDSSIPDRLLKIDNLDILHHQNAIGTIWLSRNKILINDKPEIQTNPAFVFRTPPVSFNNVLNPYLINHERWDIAAELGVNGKLLVEQLDALFSTLLRPPSGDKKEQYDFELRLSCRFGFPMAKGKGIHYDMMSTLPVLLGQRMTKKEIQNQSQTVLSKKIKHWIEENDPPLDGASFIFGINLFSKLEEQAKSSLPMFRIEHLELKLADIGDYVTVAEVG